MHPSFNYLREHRRRTSYFARRNNQRSEKTEKNNGIRKTERVGSNSCHPQKKITKQTLRYFFILAVGLLYHQLQLPLG